MSYDNIHQGLKTVGGKQCYFRSSWEWRMAKILEHWKHIGLCWDWEHEPDSYPLIAKKGEHKRYLPDFKIWTSDNTYYYIEIKGKFPAKDKRRLANFHKQYPDPIVELIREKKYKQLLEQYKKAIPDLMDDF